VTLTLRLSAAAPAAVLDVEGASPRAMRANLTPDKTFTGSLMVEKDGNYRLLLKDTQNRTIQQHPDVGNGDRAPDIQSLVGRSQLKGYYPIRAIPDPPPRVEFLAPNRDVTAAPGTKVPMKIKGFDKYGLRHLKLISYPEKAPNRREIRLQQSYPRKNREQVVVDHEFAVGKDTPDDGSTVIVYYAEVTDNRVLESGAGYQTSTSRRFKITVQDPAKVAEESARRFEELRRRLMAILKMQEIQRVNAEICWKKHKELAKIAADASRIATEQRTIRRELLDLVENFPFEPNMAPIQTALGLLASNEAQLAIDQAQVLGGISSMNQRDRMCAQLTITQDRIIETLRTLLAILPSLRDTPTEKEKKVAGQDLPPETREKLRKLKQDLEKFIDQQRKVIEGSERLAKKPVDDFTSEDDKLLQELLATQDKWEKFINETFTDFSKLAQQDFSNPSMLKELLSVKSDVTMAKDALKKKATEIATALEDNGIENATELTANLEKWLPDQPDRVKWAMEDPIGGQENIEQPELPTELEDLVGDLLEQEEDLFDEIDDISSKYTMSGDKGIGWDAMDGPISSMNAQGVTGNQLPNTNELSGRSGEGRQGKSSGEFVQDEAVGKGGRRTPTRLTPEPFQKGQVKDKSTEPPGGATGGGKISGAGEEGLEGPVPPPLAKELERLAGQQAALINRAERIQTQFKTKDYANFKFLQGITLMNEVRNDLGRYRYQNALRLRKELLGTIQQSKWLLKGKIDVSTDTSTTMPKYIRDGIADAMRGKLPSEFRTILEQYYRRLGEISE
jgi:hypothetical protein